MGAAAGRSPDRSGESEILADDADRRTLNDVACVVVSRLWVRLTRKGRTAVLEDSTVEEPWWNERSPLAGSHRNGLAWLAVAGLACLVFEVTSSESLALAIGCLKFAWHDFVIAHKIRRSDPDRVRGQVVAGFYRAWGLYKASWIAVLLMFILIFAGAQFDRAGLHRLLQKAATALTLAFGGFTLSVACSAIVIRPALRHRIKIWVGKGRNKVGFILFANVMALFFCYSLGIVMLMAAVYKLGRLLGVVIPDQVMSAVSGAFIVIGVSIGGAMLILGSMEYFSNLRARSPSHCYPVPIDLHPRAPEVAPFADDPSHQGFVIE